MQTSSEYHTNLAPEPAYTSRLGDNPWKLVNRRSREGRRIRAIVLRLLDNIPGRDDPLVIEHAIGIAQLMIRAAELRANPLVNAAEAAVLVRIEHLIDQRTRRLAFARSKATTPSPSLSPTLPPLHELLERVRAAERAASI